MLVLLLERPTSEEHPAPRPAASQKGWRRWRGWVEAVALFVVYQSFEWLRTQTAGSPVAAQRNARQIVGAERTLGIFHERAIQQWFLPHHFVVELWDFYYGTIHFAVPVVALWLLWRRTPDRYRHHLNALAAATLLGLIGFWLYPLTPPRLLPAHYGFVDTAARIGGMGVFDSGSMRDTGNLFAAMPSLHLTWSTWCAIVLVPVLRQPWLRALAILYPLITLAAVVITGNHYLLDAVGGWIVLAGGWLIATGIERSMAKVVPLRS
jgi:PAP2 superfamily protein